jgi:hypothetical protein
MTISRMRERKPSAPTTTSKSRSVPSSNVTWTGPPAWSSAVTVVQSRTGTPSCSTALTKSS